MTFDGTKFTHSDIHSVQNDWYDEQPCEKEEINIETEEIENASEINLQQEDVEEDTNNDVEEDEDSSSYEDAEFPEGMPLLSDRTRKRKPPSWFQDYDMTCLALSAECYIDDVPLDPEDLKNRFDKEEWRKAIDEELKSLKENNTWTEAKLPIGKRAIETKWVFRLKKDKNGNIERHKQD